MLSDVILIVIMLNVMVKVMLNVVMLNANVQNVIMLNDVASNIGIVKWANLLRHAINLESKLIYMINPRQNKLEGLLLYSFFIKA